MGAPAGLDWAWAQRTGGVLTPQQSRQLIAPVLRSVAQLAGERTRWAFGRRGPGRLDLDALRWPDTPLARAALEHVRGELAPALLGHSLRTYLFGLVLADLDRVAVDEELVFTASLFHDLTLGAPVPGRCFAVVSGEAARAWCSVHGAAPERAEAVGAACAGHFTPGAAEDLSDPAGFVSAGALLDVTGARWQETDPAWVREVLTRHPRLGFKQVLLEAFAAECDAVPGGRPAWLRRWAQLPLLVRLAPFSE